MSTEATAQSVESNVGKIEAAGLDTIPESEHKGKASDLFMPWFAANISVLGISWGAWILGFGLSFWQAVAASVIGITLSFVACGIIAIAGKRGHAPTLTLSRAAFGFNGNRLSAAISWMLTVGWETVLCILATLASATIFQALGWHNQIGAQVVGFIVVVVLASAAGVLGFDTIMKVQTWITYITGVITVIYLFLTVSHIDMGAIGSLPSGSVAAFIGALTMVATGFGLGWVNASADYSRYLPSDTSSAKVAGWTTLGAALPCVVLAIFGVLLVGSDPELGTKIDSDPIGALTTILPTWFMIPFAIVAILGLVGGIVMDLYSSGLSLLATGVRVPRAVATGIDAGIMTLGTIAVVFFAGDFLGPFQGFLITLGVVIAAWAGVMIAEVILRKSPYRSADLYRADGVYGSVNWEAVSLVLVGTVVGWGFVVNSAAWWLDWQGYFLGIIGGKEGDWAYANLGVLFALLIGLVGHLILGRRGVQRQEGYVLEA
ncbi:MAG: cytosine permease [Actinomycetaceae bacterium]|nr:cytosine permease [Actinomycetaceae bacterium]